MDWQRQSLELDGGILTYYVQGAGDPVIFISGGPGDSHYYLRDAARLWVEEHRCILYDQRGTGNSFTPDSSRVTVDQLLRDLDQLQRHLGYSSIRIVGHSWGATLGLLYALYYPEAVSHLALVGLGPIREQNARVAAANLRRPLTGSESQHFDMVARQRKEAVISGDFETAWNCQMTLMGWFVRSWFYDQVCGQKFLRDL